MKRTIVEHGQILENMRHTLSSLMAERENRTAHLNLQIDRLSKDCYHLETQIRVAMSEHREGFDKDKFLARRKPK